MKNFCYVRTIAEVLTAQKYFLINEVSLALHLMHSVWEAYQPGLFQALSTRTKQMCTPKLFFFFEKMCTLLQIMRQNVFWPKFELVLFF